MVMTTLHTTVAASALALALGCSAAAQAQSAAEFYPGKNLKIVVSFAPGGGYDAYARLMARHIWKHIPGEPTIVVQNMPGAAGIVAANNIYVVAPQDGTVIAAVDQNIPMVQLLGGKGVRYDMTQVQWLGTMATSNGIAMTWHESSIKSVEDAKSREVIMGTTGSNDASYIYAQVMNALLGTKFKPVTGYAGTSAVNLAIERGEVEAMGRATYLSMASQKGDWLRDKKVNVIIQLGLEKQPELPDVPLLSDLVKTEDDRQIAALVTVPTAIGYSHWVGPKVPADRAQLLRAAYQAALKDAALLADAEKVHLDIRPQIRRRPR